MEFVLVGRCVGVRRVACVDEYQIKFSGVFKGEKVEKVVFKERASNAIMKIKEDYIIHGVCETYGPKLIYAKIIKVKCVEVIHRDIL